jgi:hypothetical protein
MKKRLLIALAVLGALVVVTTVVVTGVIPMGTVILRLDQETYHPDETVTLTILSLRTGSVRFGYGFEVQRYENDDWVGVPLDVFFKSVDLVLLPGQSYEQSFVPGQYFVETPETGRYRVVKEFRVRPALYGAFRAIHGTEHTLVAEFDIVELVQRPAG